MKREIIQKAVLCLSLAIALVSADLFLLEQMVWKKLDLKEVPVCVETIRQGETIQVDDIAHVMIPSAYLMNQILTDDNEIIGSTVNRGYMIPAGSLFYESALNTKKDHPIE